MNSASLNWHGRTPDECRLFGDFIYFRNLVWTQLPPLTRLPFNLSSKVRAFHSTSVARFTNMLMYISHHEAWRHWAAVLMWGDMFYGSNMPLSLGDGRAHIPSTPERSEFAAADRRIAIVTAALELFAVQGFRNTTMDKLGDRVGIRGPSIYRHFSSKQQLLSEIMFATMDGLITGFDTVVATTNDIAEQLRRAVEVHVRYHARHRFEAFVGTREIGSLNEPARSAVITRRDTYEKGFREIIQRGSDEGRFEVPSARLASYAILDMGMGVAVWFREDGPLSEEEVVRHYGEMALSAVGGGSAITKGIPGRIWRESTYFWAHCAEILNWYLQEERPIMRQPRASLISTFVSSGVIATLLISAEVSTDQNGVGTFRRSAPTDHPSLQGHTVVSNPQSACHILLNDQHRDVRLVKILQSPEYIRHYDGWKSEWHLVDYQKLWAHHEHSGQREHLLLATRKTACSLIRSPTKNGEHLKAKTESSTLFFSISNGPNTHSEVLMHRQIRKYASSFWKMEDPHFPDPVGGTPCDVFTLKNDTTGVNRN
jgi:AcrR family transcriptional regulator